MTRTTKTARELADFLGCALEGGGEVLISGVASPDSAGVGDLIYVDAPRHLSRAAASAARCVVIGPAVDLPGKVLLRAVNPKLAFARAAAWLIPAPTIAMGIHPTAIIAPGARLGPDVAVGPYAVIEEEAQIGAGTQIGAFCFVGKGAQLGKNCRLYPRVTIYPGARLRDRVILHSGAVIGSDGFGYVTENGKRIKFPQIGGVEIQDDVEIGANATVDRGALDLTRIGTGAKLDNLVHVAHNVTIGENTVIAAQTGVSGSSTVGANVAIGGQVGIADHCEIEDSAVLGAQAGIPTGKTIRKGQVVWGTPARPLAKFKEQFVFIARLPELAGRIKKLEALVLGKAD